jgi:hypothetical protein
MHLRICIRQHTSAYVSIRQHTSAYVSIRGECVLDATENLLGVAVRKCLFKDTRDTCS